jgi:hypothetical protein
MHLSPPLRRPPRFPWLLAFVVAASITCGGGDLLDVPDEPVPAVVRVLRGDAQLGRVGEPLPVPIRPGRELRADLSLTATVGAPDSLALVRGEEQGGRVGESLTDSLVVEVVDRFGNPVPGVTVDWSIAGGGSVSDTETETDAAGTTGVTRRLGSRTGEQSTAATVGSLRGSPFVFHHTALPGDVSVLIAIGGGGQRGPVSTELRDALLVRAEDAEGNPIAGREVHWTVTSGGAARTRPRASPMWTVGRGAAGRSAPLLGQRR